MARKARVNILQRVKTEKGWTNRPLARTPKGSIRWPSGGRFFIEWRENGRRLRESAGNTPSEALEAQTRKGLHLDANRNGFELKDLSVIDDRLPLRKAVDQFLKDIRTFRKPLTYLDLAEIEGFAKQVGDVPLESGCQTSSL